MRFLEFMQTNSELKRFFVNFPNSITTLPADVRVADAVTAHHLKSVLRAKPGEAVVVVDAERQVAYKAKITDLQKVSVDFRVEEALQIVADPLPQVTLAVALIKEQRWDWLLQKATELGVQAIQPLMTERSIIRLDAKDFAKKQERWQAVLRSAAEQSEGLFIPQIETPCTVQNFLRNSQKTDVLCLILEERGAARQPMREALRNTQAKQPLLLAIGPEGGWTVDELTAFEQAGFTGVSLGHRILRAETAAVAAMVAVVYEHGE